MILACAAAMVAEAGSSRWARDEKLAIRRVEILTAAPAAWKRVDFRLDLSGSFRTPFDPAEIAVDARFRLPSGREMVVPAFLDQAFARTPAAGPNEVAPLGDPEWRVRFMPPEAGAYALTVTARDHSGVVNSAPLRFEVTPGTGHGYIHVSRSDPHYFEFEDGTPYFAIGENIQNGNLDDLDRCISRLGGAGGNFVRFWQGSPAYTVELGKLGEYRLDNAARFDQVLGYAERSGVYLKLTLDWVRHLTPPPPPEQRSPTFRLGDYAYREDYPYRTANGGPCETIADVFTMPEARRLFKARLRYLVARWGYSPNVFAWELWNEIGAVDKRAARPEILVPWTQEMGRYLQATDPYRHITTPSMSRINWPEMWTVPENEIPDIHGYYRGNEPEDEYTQRDMFQFMTKRLSYIKNHNKPYFFGEFGVMFDAPLLKGLPPDSDGVYFHNGLWVPLAFGAAGTGHPWFWRAADTNNWYRHFHAIAKFVQDIPWPTAGFSKMGVEPSRPDLHVLGLHGRALSILWVQNAGHTWWNTVHGVPLQAVENASLEAAGFAPGRYRIEFWNTYEGRIEKTDYAVAANGFIRVALPPIKTDIAIKVIAGTN